LCYMVPLEMSFLLCEVIFGLGLVQELFAAPPVSP